MDIEDVINEVNELDDFSDTSQCSKHSNLINENDKEFTDIGIQCYLDKELIIPVDIYNIRNIVFAGGGARIFSQFGFIKALEEHNLLNNVK